MEESRREFLKDLGKKTLTLAALPHILNLMGWIGEEAEAAMLGNYMEVEFYKRLPDKKIQCFVCPRHCILDAGETCFCLTRKNHDGRLYAHAFNNPCKLIPDDPIEKLPLHHYYPGAQTLSIATGGCNMRCLYCQNWQISQKKPEEVKTFSLTKEEATEGARSTGVKALAFTYTEPVSFLEYAKTIAKYAKPRGIKSVCATALFINEKPLKDLCRYIDAFAVALKGFSETFYQKVCGEPLKPVLDAIITLKKQRKWFEIVSLLVPTYNTSDKEIKEMCQWVRRYVGKDTPMHFSRFVPRFKLKHLPQTSVQDINRACEIAQAEGIQYVYSGNVAPHPKNNTYCHNCKKPVIERLGFKILSRQMKKNKCSNCGERIPGIF